MSNAKIGTPEWLAWNEAERKRSAASDEKKADSVVDRIDPRADRRQACRRDALKVIRQIEEQSDRFDGRHVVNDKMRKKLLRFANLVARVKPAWQDIEVFPLNMPPSLPASVDEVLEFGRRCGEAARKDKSRTPDRDAAAKRRAVKQAYRLMTKYAVEKPAANDEESKFCRLAKMLHGGGEDLTSQCKLHIRALRKGANQI
jgi:hypothetical protein